MFEPLVTHPDHDWRADGPAGARWFVVDVRSQVLMVEGEVPRGARSPVGGDNVHLLGLDDGHPVWAVELGMELGDLPEGAELVGLRGLYGKVPEADWALAGRAAQILAWDRDHRFCGRCGQPTEAHRRDRARHCGRCRLLAYPRLAPAVIMLVERDDGRILLARNAQFPGRFHSVLAGFVEPGESLEEAVVREVGEEVGVEVGDVRYFGSQPWPFPHSVMIGFNARWRSGEIACEDGEILEADWFDPDHLPPTPRGGMSIAGWLIEDWLSRVGS